MRSDTAISAIVGLLVLGTWQPQPYGWSPVSKESIAARIAPPIGFEREPIPAGSFAEWLRGLPLKEGRPPVRLYNGQLKTNQDAHVAVLDIDTGARDLQQCADAVIRLRAEYLYSQRKSAAIHFDFTSGDQASFLRWSEGFRPRVIGNRVSWQKSAEADDSYRSFRAYLDVVFNYAGMASLERELSKVTTPQDLRGGDIFIQPGYPGHAVIVVDVARDREGRKVFLLAQSYMPAQDMQILRNPESRTLSPWYDANFGSVLRTPEWTFNASHLRRFREQGPSF
jgi:hypothetical protein